MRNLENSVDVCVSVGDQVSGFEISCVVAGLCPANGAEPRHHTKAWSREILLYEQRHD